MSTGYKIIEQGIASETLFFRYDLARRLSRTRVIFFINMFYLLISCTTTKLQYANKTTDAANVLDTIGQVETNELILAREICIEGSLSTFCDDGHEQPFRSYPAFVRLNASNFIHSYDNAVYMLAIPSVLDTLTTRNVKYKTPWALDSLFQNTITEYNTISFEVSNVYKRKVNKYQKEIKSNKIFDGILSYSLYKMKFECVYGGKRKVIIPDIEQNLKEGIKICDIYYITNISTIQPISKEEFLK